LDRYALTLNGQTKTYGTVILSPDGWFQSNTAHEMGHGFGLSHANAILRGEYGDSWDIMGTGNGYPGLYGNSGPGLSTTSLYALDWIPGNRMFIYDFINYPAPYHVATVTLAPLHAPGAHGYLIARVFAGGTVYTVEFRSKGGWDSGFLEIPC